VIVERIAGHTSELSPPWFKCRNSPLVSLPLLLLPLEPLLLLLLPLSLLDELLVSPDAELLLVPEELPDVVPLSLLLLLSLVSSLLELLPPFLRALRFFLAALAAAFAAAFAATLSFASRSKSALSLRTSPEPFSSWQHGGVMYCDQLHSPHSHAGTWMDASSILGLNQHMKRTQRSSKAC
jgi:hypothetical protein